MKAHLSPKGLNLGYTAEKPSLGFLNQPVSATDLIGHEGEGHLMTIAPTGSGKGRSCVIPTLLTYPGSTLTVDLKGECYHVTAERRRKMGHRVVALDIFKEVVEHPDCLNPFDLLRLPNSQPDSDIEMLSEMISGGRPILSKDIFWELTARGLLTGLIGYMAEAKPPEERNFGQVLDLLYDPEIDFKIASVMDEFKFQNKLVKHELGGYLSHESEKCRPSVRSTAQAMSKAFDSEAVRTGLGQTTFDLDAWYRGDQIDIYLIFPAEKLLSHQAVLRLLVGTLTTILLRRKFIAKQRTLLLMDECAQLGTLDQLRTSMTLLRGYGVQTWTFWQDMSQLKHLYPLDWETILNNAGVVQAFGMPNGRSAAALGEVLGVPTDELLKLPKNEQFLLKASEQPIKARKLDYLADKMFKNLYAPNPRYEDGHVPPPNLFPHIEPQSVAAPATLCELNITDEERASYSERLKKTVESHRNMFLVRGTDSTGRKAWYYVMIKPNKKILFEGTAKRGQTDLVKFGKIIASAYGEDPPPEVKKRMKEEYGFTST